MARHIGGAQIDRRFPFERSRFALWSGLAGFGYPPTRLGQGTDENENENGPKK